MLILGLGNILMGDEGIGVKAVEYMQDKPLPDHVSLLDGGTGGFHLLSLFQEFPRLIILDATLGDDSFGDIRVLKPRYASDFPRSLTSHDIGLKDLVESAELLDDFPRVILITIQIGAVKSVQVGISPELEKRLPEVYQTVQEVLKSW